MEEEGAGHRHGEMELLLSTGASESGPGISRHLRSQTTPVQRWECQICLGEKALPEEGTPAWGYILCLFLRLGSSAPTPAGAAPPLRQSFTSSRVLGLTPEGSTPRLTPWETLGETLHPSGWKNEMNEKNERMKEMLLPHLYSIFKTPSGLL